MEPQNSPKVDWNEEGLQHLHKQLNEIREAIVLMYYVSANTASKEQVEQLYKRIMSLYRYSLDVDNH